MGQNQSDPQPRSSHVRSATAETLHSSRSAVSHGDPPVLHDHRHFSLTLAVLQHFFHPGGVELHVEVDMVWMRLTGAGGVGSALFPKDGHLVHIMPPNDKVCWRIVEDSSPRLNQKWAFSSIGIDCVEVPYLQCESRWMIH